MDGTHDLMFRTVGGGPAVDILLFSVVEVSDRLAIHVAEVVSSTVSEGRGRHYVNSRREVRSYCVGLIPSTSLPFFAFFEQYPPLLEERLTGGPMTR